MERIDLFMEGDIVVFKLDSDNLSESSDNAKFCVVGKSNNKVLISKRGQTSEASPFELLTAQEVKQAEKEASDAVDNYMKN